MKVLHITTLFPNSEEHLLNGAGGHAVYYLIDSLRKEMGKNSQTIYFYQPFLAPYYGFFSRSKFFNQDLKKAPWYPGMKYKKMPTLPYGILNHVISHAWQKTITIDPILKLDYDVIHLHTARTLGLLTCRIKERSKKPLIVTIRRELHNRFWGALTKTEQKTIRAAIAASDIVASPSALSVGQAASLFSRRIEVIPNGTSTIFDDLKDISKREGKTILFVGNLDENKNVMLLIRIFKRIVHKEPSAKLRIIGNGPLKNAVEKAIEGVNAIEYLGRLSQQQIKEEMRRAGILCVPSITETFGIVYAEGMKQEIAVVARSGTGIDGHGIKGKHYELIDSDDELEPLLLNLLSDRKKCEFMGKMGRELAMAWNWDRSAKQYYNLYKDLVY